MKYKAFFIIFKGLSLKQIKPTFLEGERDPDFTVFFLVQLQLENASNTPGIDRTLVNFCVLGEAMHFSNIYTAKPEVSA